MTHSTRVESSLSETMRESLSALMDGEASEIELHRILAQTNDDEVRAAWSRLHRNSDIMHGVAVFSGMDISRAVSQAVAEAGPAVAPRTSAASGVRRSIASFAVAASVTAAVVFTGQQMLLTSSDTVPALPSSPGLVNSSGAVPVRASLGSRSEQPALQTQPAMGITYQDLARQQLRKYSQAHAEQAALNTPQGMVPFARVRDIQPK